MDFSLLSYALLATGIVSLLSLVGVFTLSMREDILKKGLIYLVSFAAGALFGDVFIHLLPEIVEESGWTLGTSLAILSGLVVSFLIEKVIHWRHCHLPFDKQHVHRFAYMNLVGDALHNFMDGLIIGASFLAGIPAGIATTVAVLLHELPQEIGDLAVLMHGGLTRRKALFYNFVTALTAIAGTVTAFIAVQRVEWLNQYLIPFTAGSFIYIAGADLIPELHKEGSTRKGVLQLLLFIGGIAIMLAMILLE